MGALERCFNSPQAGGVKVGTKVFKLFDGEWFEGVIDGVSFPEDSGDDQSIWYHIVFDDGDNGDYIVQIST